MHEAAVEGSPAFLGLIGGCVDRQPGSVDMDLSPLASGPAGWSSLPRARSVPWGLTDAVLVVGGWLFLQAIFSPWAAPCWERLRSLPKDQSRRRICKS